MRATYVIFDGLSFTFAGVTSGAAPEIGLAAPPPSAEAAGDAAGSGFALREHAASAPAETNAIPAIA
jgi:hypothetical protein